MTRIATLFLAAAALAACARGNDADSDRNQNTTTDTAGGAVTATPLPTQMNDANIVAVLDAANASDSASGQLASTKGTSSEVRNYGKMMVGEHHLLREQGQALAKKENITPMAPTGDPTQSKGEQSLKMLQDMQKGAAWDKMYIDNEVQVHEQVLQTAKQAHDQAQNAELKALIEKAQPVIEKHLERAREIQKNLTPST
ncbi:MAG TPA: DUF4142 domain-containing protein [Gemmatimonadaceae bacterium]|nr:DUF4142 domain-containing protein [Gemmatimonadaceae bacterium]